MFPNYDSSYIGLAKQELLWLPNDSEELYKKNIIENFDELKKYGWLDTKFTYKFNSMGFRCEEFTEENSIMFLGCSFTIGIGLPLKTIWPELVGKELKMNIANLGQGGGAPDTAFRMCHGYIDKIKPKIVIYMVPPPFRVEFVTDDLHYVVSAWYEHNKILKEWAIQWAIDENNTYFNYTKNSLAIEYLCRQRNIKYICVNSEKLYSETIDKARDLAHAGIKTHAKLANNLLTSI